METNLEEEGEEDTESYPAKPDSRRPKGTSGSAHKERDKGTKRLTERDESEPRDESRVEENESESGERERERGEKLKERGVKKRKTEGERANMV